MIPFIHDKNDFKFRFSEVNLPTTSSNLWNFSYIWAKIPTGYLKIDSKPAQLRFRSSELDFFMDFGGANQPRVIGDYILGPRIGSGSFAVVWLSRNRHSGEEVAVKEIDKKHLTQKVSENLFKEISILRNINHPNIIRLFEAIQVMDYCLTLFFSP